MRLDKFSTKLCGNSRINWTAWSWFNFKTNNMWNSFDPSTQSYDTTLYGKWVFETLKENCMNVISSTEIKNDINGMILFPNPASNQITIKNNNQHWEIYNNLGISILKGTSETIDINNFETGMYILISETEHIKFIKQ